MAKCATDYLGWLGLVTLLGRIVLVHGNWRTGGPGEYVYTTASVEEQ